MTRGPVDRGSFVAVRAASGGGPAPVPTALSALIRMGGGGWRRYADGHDPPPGVRGRERKIRLGEAGDLQPEAHHALVASELVCGGETAIG